MRWPLAGALLGALWALGPPLAGRSNGTPAGADSLVPSSPGLATVLIVGVPHIRQAPDFCGEACVAMWMQKLGLRATQEWVFDQSNLDPMRGRGCYAPELKQALTRIGFKVGPVWSEVPAKDEARLQDHFKALVADLHRGVPSIVCMRYSSDPNAPEHFRLVLGYDAATDRVIFHEPAKSKGAYVRMARSEFLRLWPLANTRKGWTLIRLSLEANARELTPPQRAKGRTPAQYCQHAMKVMDQMPEGFSLALAEPFVVVGDGDPREVQAFARNTVAWAVKRLKESFFRKDPSDIITIWLFQDRESYLRNTWKLFKEKPDTPYGYYSPKDRALIMNISTGPGTLVHEIVHPFIHSNFPDCPPWLNEGLGSLFEQCGERNGKIIGRTNWRLSGLQNSIRKREILSFEALTGLNEDQFYGEDRYDVHYAQARYLCYYLQERGLLQAFYHRLVRQHAQDPGGYKTLISSLGSPDMAAFQARWQSWVLRLKFPE